MIFCDSSFSQLLAGRRTGADGRERRETRSVCMTHSEAGSGNEDVVEAEQGK